MFDKLDDLLRRYEEIMNELHEPDVANDQTRFRKLMKEQSDLTPIVEAYTEYKKCKQDVEDSIQMLEEENDEEMRKMLKEELSAMRRSGWKSWSRSCRYFCCRRTRTMTKNVVVEIRAGAGGDEAALFAAELCRMYVHYAESPDRWKVEIVSINESRTSVA